MMRRRSAQHGKESLGPSVWRIFTLLHNAKVDCAAVEWACYRAKPQASPNSHGKSYIEQKIGHPAHCFLWSELAKSATIDNWAVLRCPQQKLHGTSCEEAATVTVASSIFYELQVLGCPLTPCILMR